MSFLEKQITTIQLFFINLFASLKPKTRLVPFFVLLAVLLVMASFFFFGTNFSHAQTAPAQPTQTTPKPQPMTPAQIQQIPGWANWDPNTKPPAGTILSDPITFGDTGQPAVYHLIPADSFTITNNVVGPAANAVSKVTGAIKDAFVEVVLAVVIGVLAVIAAFCKELVGFGAQALDLTLNPSLYNFTNNDMVRQGWMVTRDVCNLFFLLALLFIAICTILKIEKYHAKKTLLMLIIMALLINFSKPIAVFIFDGSQILMNFFLTQMGQTGTGQTVSTVVSKATGIANMVYNTLPGYWGSDKTSLEIAVQYLFAVIFLFMLGVAFFVTALMLIIRIVAIMILIIVSPFAFFFAIIPDFSKMSSKWWSSLFEYSYYGPAAAFFLLLATKLENAIPNLTTTVGGSSMGNFTMIINNILHYLTVLVFLYASIIMAKQFGGGAGAAIVGNSNRFMKWAGGMGKGGGMWGGIARGTGVADVYKGTRAGIAKQPGWRVLTKEGREARSKERQEKYERKVAPFSMADARKRAKDGEFKDQAKVDTGISKGNADDLLIASKRGTLSKEQLDNRVIQDLIARNPELRKEVLGNLRDKGQSHMAAYTRSLTPKQEDASKQNMTLQDFGKEEIYNNKKLGDMDWEKVISFEHKGEKPFEQILVNRLDNIAQTNAQGFLNIASNLDGTKQDILRDNPKFQAVLASAQENARNRNAGSQSNTGSQTGGYQSGGYGP